MAAYLTEIEFLSFFDEEEIIQLTNLNDATATTVESTRLQSAIERASDEIDSLLRRSWTLPLTNIPRILKTWCADIVRYFLDFNNPREDVYLRYREAKKAIQEVAERKRDIGLDENDEPVPPKNQIGICSSSEIFSEDALSGYI